MATGKQPGGGLEILMNWYYTEKELMTGLRLSQRWLRRTVGCYRAGRQRLYRGGDILACLIPAPRK